MNRSSGSRNRGFVLVSVLFLCVMLVASATAFAWFVRIQLHAVIREKETQSARSIAYLLAKEALRGLALDTNSYDSALESWFQPLFVPLDGYGIANLILSPLDDKIPLDKLFLPDGVTLRNELKDTWENVWAELMRRDLAAKVLDFIDKDSKPRLGGYEVEKNLNRAPTDISELLDMEGMTPELLYGSPQKPGLDDYADIWTGNKININTAPPRVLALLGGLNAALADEIVALRRKNEISALGDLKEIVGFPLKAIPVLANIVGFESTFFLLRIELLTNDGAPARYFEIILNKPNGKIVRWEEK